MVTTFKGHAVLYLGDDDRAKALYEQSLALWRELGDKSELASVLRSLGRVAERKGDTERATVLLKEGLALAREVGSKGQLPYLQYSLGNVSLRQGDHQRAMTLYRESLIQLRDMGEKQSMATCLEGLAGAACAQGSCEQAVKILGAAEAFREVTGFQRPPFQQADRDQCMASTRAVLGEQAFAAAWAKGRAMTIEQAIEYALAIQDKGT